MQTLLSLTFQNYIAAASFFPQNFVLCVPPAVHTVAHLLNVEWYNNSRQGVYDDLSTALSNLPDDPQQNTTYLNPIRITDLVRDPVTMESIAFQRAMLVGALPVWWLGSLDLLTLSKTCTSLEVWIGHK